MKKNKKKQTIPKNKLFNYHCFLFFGGSKISLFTTWPKSGPPKNTIKIGVSANQFLKTDDRHANFTKKQSRHLSYQFLFVVLTFEQQNTKCC